MAMPQITPKCVSIGHWDQRRKSDPRMSEMATFPWGRYANYTLVTVRLPMKPKHHEMLTNSGLKSIASSSRIEILPKRASTT